MEDLLTVTKRLLDRLALCYRPEDRLDQVGAHNGHADLDRDLGAVLAGEIHLETRRPIRLEPLFDTGLVERRSGKEKVPGLPGRQVRLIESDHLRRAPVHGQDPTGPIGHDDRIGGLVHQEPVPGLTGSHRCEHANPFLVEERVEPDEDQDRDDEGEIEPLTLEDL